MIDFGQAIEGCGFAIVPNVLPEPTIASLLEQLADPALRRSRAGIRHALSLPAIAAIAHDDRLIGLARAVLGSDTIPFRATLFDKSPVSNWLVVWHQDTALPLRIQHRKVGW